MHFLQAKYSPDMKGISSERPFHAVWPPNTQVIFAEKISSKSRLPSGMHPTRFEEQSLLETSTSQEKKG
jgi:hypothetical protein